MLVLHAPSTHIRFRKGHKHSLLMLTLSPRNWKLPGHSDGLLVFSFSFMTWMEEYQGSIFLI